MSGWWVLKCIPQNQRGGNIKSEISLCLSCRKAMQAGLCVIVWFFNLYAATSQTDKIILLN
jgi:hypothetical protein